MRGGQTPGGRTPGSRAFKFPHISRFCGKGSGYTGPVGQKRQVKRRPIRHSCGFPQPGRTSLILCRGKGRGERVRNSAHHICQESGSHRCPIPKKATRQGKFSRLFGVRARFQAESLISAPLSWRRNGAMRPGETREVKSVAPAGIPGRGSIAPSRSVPEPPSPSDPATLRSLPHIKYRRL